MEPLLRGLEEPAQRDGESGRKAGNAMALEF